MLTVHAVVNDGGGGRLAGAARDGEADSAVEGTLGGIGTAAEATGTQGRGARTSGPVRSSASATASSWEVWRS